MIFTLGSCHRYVKTHESVGRPEDDGWDKKSDGHRSPRSWQLHGQNSGPLLSIWIRQQWQFGSCLLLFLSSVRCLLPPSVSDSIQGRRSQVHALFCKVMSHVFHSCLCLSISLVRVSENKSQIHKWIVCFLYRLFKGNVTSDSCRMRPMIERRDLLIFMLSSPLALHIYIFVFE